ncbi:MAG: hypothetical protein Q8R29_01230 [bacterium]|nr:hypothetical protein [bacterium]
MPNLIFINSLGEEYKGIPMLQTANEDAYLARIREIVDGHWLVGSFTSFEYKNYLPLTPPTGEFFYAIPSLLFNISPVNTLIASKLFFPAILFVLVYYLIYLLIESGGSVWQRKLSSLAGAFVVTLGYDLVDYRNLWGFLSGKIDLTDQFLLWARPVNPILGAIFLFSFLIILWGILTKSENSCIRILTAGMFLALMMGSYFFSWGIAVSILGTVVLIYLSQKNFKIVKRLVGVVLVALVLSSPYWYMSWLASQNPWYKDSILRSGIFYTHHPILNKFILASLVFYFILIFIDAFKFLGGHFRLREIASFLKKEQLNERNIFCLATLLGSLWAYNQQVVTGVTLWPYHFVQYSIPLVFVFFITLLHNIIKKWSKLIWFFVVFLIIISSLAFGIYTQTSVFYKHFGDYKKLQLYDSVISWLNNKEKDCVVLISNDSDSAIKIENLIPSFTHCNLYISNAFLSLMPSDRIYHNYLIYLRLKGISAKSIDKYLNEHKPEIRKFLLNNWKEVYQVKNFPDFTYSKSESRIANIAKDYKDFSTRDFRSELSRYKLDFILSVGELDKNILKQLPGTKLDFKSDNTFIYKFAK